MLQTIKKQICLQKSDWLLGTGCELGMWLMGIAFMLVMQRSDPEDTYVLLGTIFAIIGSAGVATFIMLYGLGIKFNTQISYFLLYRVGGRLFRIFRNPASGIARRACSVCIHLGRNGNKRRI